MLYNGETYDGTPTQGLATLLNSVDAKHGDQSLVTVTQQVFEEAKTAVDAIPETLSESIVNGESYSSNSGTKNTGRNSLL